MPLCQSAALTLWWLSQALVKSTATICGPAAPELMDADGATS